MITDTAIREDACGSSLAHLGHVFPKRILQAPVFLVGLRLFSERARRKSLLFPLSSFSCKANSEEEKAKLAILRTDVPSSQYNVTTLIILMKNSSLFGRLLVFTHLGSLFTRYPIAQNTNNKIL